MMQSWPADLDAQERTRRLLDLFLVSVLLDAGAGTKWQYRSKDNGKIYRRSEGLAVASLDMFKSGLFSSNPEQKEQVDGRSRKLIGHVNYCNCMLTTSILFRDGVEGSDCSAPVRWASSLANESH